jgi:DNA-binding LytR/AlgR family response regulator
VNLKLGALVVEDEWATRNYLVELLQASGAVDIVGAVASAEDARLALDAAHAAGRDAAIDVAFVDVQLVGSAADDEGLELVRARASRPGAPMFVLATAFPEHALEAFDLGVVDYLLKPFTEARVAQSIARIRARRSPRAPTAAPRFVARKKRALVFLRLDEVLAFESAERLAYVHTTRGRFDVDLSLSAIELSLGAVMLRVHRSWLVNADYVRELDGCGSETGLVVGADASACVRVPVARERAQGVRDALLGNTMGIRAR